MNFTRDYASPIGVIFFGWLLAILGIFAMSKMGYPVGFNVWPLGEDRGWVTIMNAGDGRSLAQAFWQVNDRNPLSPWWYAAAKPILLGSENGILFVRYAMSLLCGVALFLCLDTVGGKAIRWFAVGAGVLCAVFFANQYIDNIYWNFLGALALSLLSVWSYCRYRETSSTGWYGLSIALWFFALGTYTIQTGAAIAVAYLALRGGGTVIERLWRAFRDAAPYVAVFVGFYLVWQTTAIPERSPYYETEPSLSGALTSLSLAFWHPVFGSFISWARATLSSWQGAVWFAASFVVVLALMLTIQRRRPEPRPAHTWVNLLDIVVVAFCLALPTIAIEASSSVWGPGTRWLMIHQLWVPVYMCIVGAFALALAQFVLRDKTRGSLLWAVLVAFGASALMQTNAEHNRVQVLATETEQALYRSMSAELAADPALKNFIVKVEPGALWMTSQLALDTYMHAWFPSREVTMRIVPAFPSPAGWEDWWAVGFGPDAEGIANGLVYGGTVPYAASRILSLGPEGVTNLSGAEASAFDGYEVDWRRSASLP